MKRLGYFIIAFTMSLSFSQRVFAEGYDNIEVSSDTPYEAALTASSERSIPSSGSGSIATDRSIRTVAVIDSIDRALVSDSLETKLLIAPEVAGRDVASAPMAGVAGGEDIIPIGG